MTSDEERRAAWRREHWNAKLAPYLRSFSREMPKGFIPVTKRLYFGEPFDLGDDQTRHVAERAHPVWLLFAVERQGPELWDRYLRDIAPALGHDDPKRLIEGHALFEYADWLQPLFYGLTLEEDRAYFRYWWGDTYHPDGPMLFGRRYPGAIEPRDVCLYFACRMDALFAGRASYLSKESNLYEFWLDVIDAVDPRVFEPRVNRHDDVFSGCGNGAMVRWSRVKSWTASVLQTLHRPEQVVSGFDQLKAEAAEGRPWLLPIGMDHMTGEDVLSLPVLVDLRQRLRDDLDGGRLPDSLRALDEWARSPRSSLGNLETSTYRGEGYVDPWEAVPTCRPRASRKRAVSGQRARPSKLELDEAELAAVRARWRALAAEIAEHDGEVVVPPIESVAALDRLLAERGVAAGRRRALALEIAERWEREQLLDLLRPTGGRFGVEREPFDGYEPSEINDVYREAWKSLGRLVAYHARIDSVRTRRRALAEHEYALSVRVEAGGRVFEYEYEVCGTEIDESLFDDFVDFGHAVGLPGALEIDRMGTESEVFVRYSP